MDPGRQPVSLPPTAAPGAAPNAAPKKNPHDVTERDDMPLPHEPRTIYLGGLFVLAMLTALYVAQPVVLPVVIALVLKLLLQPIVRLGERVRIPKAIGAIAAILLLLGLLAALGAILSGPAVDLLRNFPDLLHRLHGRLAPLQGWSDEASKLLSPFGIDISSEGTSLQSLLGKASGMAGTVAGGASAFASHLLETLLILFYLLVFGEIFLLRLVQILPRLQDKKQAVGIAEAVERDISAYLLTITIINATVGVLCGLVMWGFGVPGAAVWGVLAFCLNYIPILGPFAGVIVFGVVGLATLGAAWTALFPAAIYLAIHFAEGEFITPMLMAKRFTLNPIAIMIALVFWSFMWGVQGAILSVPLLAITKIVSDRLRPLKAMGHMLEG